jgi:tryptophanyl-tRNA synthetase
MNSKLRILTGITTTGTPHLGNYVGAIRPAIAASREANAESFYFLADYHALVKCDDPARVQRSTLEIAASWLACGLDPEKVYFYRQSDIPEIPELTWLLTCVTAKGLLNRAHAYKATTDANRAAGEDADAGINAGLYMYPVLMAADILLFNAHKVPVGRDQIQHIEMARDIGQRFNHIYDGEYFTLPEAAIEDNVATLPGLDGRKMSKSYNNTIPLFDSRKKLRDAIMGIVTNSQAPGEPKNPDDSNIFSIYQAFANADETAAMRRAFADGIGWGDAKQKLFERIDVELAPMRERYDALIGEPDRIEEILHAGAARARALATPFVGTLREAVGLRSLADVRSTGPQQGKAKKTSSIRDNVIGRFVGPYREELRYKFRLVDADREALFVSTSYESYNEAALALEFIQGARPSNLKLAPSVNVAGDSREVVEATTGNVLGAIVSMGRDAEVALLRFFKEIESIRNSDKQ